MSDRKNRVKRERHPQEEQVRGVVTTYDPAQGSGTLDVGEETIIFFADTLRRAGYPNIKVGAQMQCGVVPGACAREVVSVAEYRIPRGAAPQYV